MSEVIKIKKGLDIKLKGKAEKQIQTAPISDTIALKPTDFLGLTPKLSVKAGAEVKAGDALFYDKYNPEIVFTAPLSGKVLSINRGERRRILEIVIQPDGLSESIDLGKADPLSLSTEEIKTKILKSGIWPLIIKRPYGVIPSPNEAPKSIFISTFDTAPLAPDYDFILKGQESVFQTGINALSKLIDGNIQLGLSTSSDEGIYGQLKNVDITKYAGPHPIGNVGIQIHKKSPINKGDIIWTINPQDVLFIGRLFETGKIDFSKVVALTGSEVEKPIYYKTVIGANISTIIEGNYKTDKNSRIISGNVLTGTKIENKGYLSFYDSSVTIIPEGDDYELLGWATLGAKKIQRFKNFHYQFIP